MMNFMAKIRKIAADQYGAMAIETALVAPILAVMSVGGFEASIMVSRQSELQSAVAEATSIVLAVTPETQAQLDDIEDVIETSSGLAENKVTLTRVYRCGNAENYQANTNGCGTGSTLTGYIRIQITDVYTPQWTHIGIGEPLTYNVDRTVQIS